MIVREWRDVTMTGELDNRTVARVYARWARFAPIYDLVFGPVLSQGRRDSIAAAERVGGRILEVGVGTGISLTEYSGKHRVVGVDYSEPMIRKAQERVIERKLTHVEALAVMDGTRLAFADESFDAVLAQYVITTVPDPEATLDEIVRVTRPGGEIILVNHLGAEAGLRRDFERSFAPMARRLGWQPEFAWARLEQWAEANGGVRLRERRVMPPLGHFSLIRFERVEMARLPEPVAMAGAAARL
jgi:phosphatidylethanolamine/phosphatidyl-N-methylethanolamine N-methyltransferase